MKSLMRALHRPIYESRLRELVRQIVPRLGSGDRVLDVGCGSGALGRALLDSPGCPAGVEVVGLESSPRGDEGIVVTAYDGGAMPFESGSFDVVIVADVLHHEREPQRLLAECVRVSRRSVIVKDHKVEGWLAQQRVSLIDWAANAPYDVPCLYTYLTHRQWRRAFERLGATVEQEERSMRLYPPIVNLLFGRRLQYLAVLRVDHCA